MELVSSTQESGKDLNPHFVIEGNGPLVTLIHGVGAALDSWDGVVERLRDSFTLLRYDLRGHGSSVKPSGPYALRDFIDDLRALLKSQEITQTHLVGFSLGGIIAQGFTLSHPDMVKRLGLISTVAGRTGAEREVVLARARKLDEQGATATVDAAVQRWFSDGFREAHPDIIEQRVAALMKNDPKAYRAAYRVLAESDLGDVIHGIQVPTLVVTGEHDIGSNTRMARLMQERIPNAELHILADLKHSVLLEAPDQIATLLRNFLAADT